MSVCRKWVILILFIACCDLTGCWGGDNDIVIPQDTLGYWLSYTVNTTNSSGYPVAVNISEDASLLQQYNVYENFNIMGPIQGSNYTQGWHTFTVSYDNGHGCSDTITNQVYASEEINDPFSQINVNISCGGSNMNLASYPVEMRTVDASKNQKWALPSNSHIKPAFEQVILMHSKIKGSPGKKKVVSLKFDNGFKNDISLSQNTVYRISGVPRLLPSCDCILHYKKQYKTAHKKTDHKRVYRVQVALAPQYLIGEEKICSDFDRSVFLHTMSVNGYNQMEFTGINFGVDSYGDGHLTFSESGSQHALTDVLPNSIALPLYANAKIYLDNAQNITQPTSLLDSMRSVAKMGLVLKINRLSDGNHFSNVSDLLMTLLDNGVGDVVLKVPSHASNSDLQKFNQLSQILLSHHVNWSGWIQANSSQIQVLSSVYKPSHLVLDVLGDSANASSVLSTFNGLKSAVIGLAVNDITYNPRDITALRKAVFLN